MRWKDVDIEFGDKFSIKNLSQILDLALERSDLVKASLGSVCAPENVEKLHAARDEGDEWDEDVW